MVVNVDLLFDFLQDIGAEPKDLGKVIECRTVCHSGDSHKLYYYKDSSSFYCYTNCGSISVYNFLSEMNCGNINEIITTNKTINKNIGFSIDPIEIPDYSLNINNNLPKLEEKKYDMGKYYNMYYSGWIEEFITPNSMNEFNIKYDLSKNRIIMPHYDKDNRLIGVRCRELDKEKKDIKYHPIFGYEFETSKNLYGINKINDTDPIIIVEAEKSVLQLNSYGYNNGLAILGSFISEEQISLINSIDSIGEIVIALDKEYEEIYDNKFLLQQKKIRKKFFDKLKKFGRTISVIVDRNNLLEEKDSPTDKGKEVFNKLFRDRVVLFDEQEVI